MTPICLPRVIEMRYRSEYELVLLPLFDQKVVDPVDFVATLVRACGLETSPMDPLAESRATLRDLEAFSDNPLSADKFTDPNRTAWRLALLAYAHIVEMSAPYNVIANLLRLHAGQRFSIGPLTKPASTSKRKTARTKRTPALGPQQLKPSDKIAIIASLAAKSGFRSLADSFAGFYNAPLRNAIGHADYVLRDGDFLSREGLFRIGGTYTPLMPYAHLEEIIARTFSFYSAFFELETSTRASLGAMAGKILPYVPSDKGLFEFLADENGLLSGFAIHWPNGVDSVCERRASRCVAQNIAWGDNGEIEFHVGLLARSPGSFSRLVEHNAAPAYSPSRTSGEALSWPT